MGDEIKGYYCKQEKTLLKDFDQTIELMKNQPNFGEQITDSLQNALEILPYVCLADIALSDAFGWGLIRTQSIGDGCEFCDFRFKKGSMTKISSKTPEVQRMIDQTAS